MSTVSKGKRVLTPFIILNTFLATKEQLVAAVEARDIQISRCARGAFEDESFPKVFEEGAAFVALPVEDFGFEKCLATKLTADFCRRWSEANLQDQRIGLCRIPDGPLIRIMWTNQEEGTVVWCATDGLKSAGFPAIWMLGRHEDGRRAICAPTVNSLVLDDGALIFRLLP